MLTYIEITWKTLFGRYSCLITKQSIAFVLKSMSVALNHHFKHHLHQSHPVVFPTFSITELLEYTHVRKKCL